MVNTHYTRLKKSSLDLVKTILAEILDSIQSDNWSDNKTQSICNNLRKLIYKQQGLLNYKDQKFVLENGSEDLLKQSVFKDTFSSVDDSAIVRVDIKFSRELYLLMESLNYFYHNDNHYKTRSQRNRFADDYKIEAKSTLHKVNKILD